MLLPALNAIHLWQIYLPDFFAQYNSFFSLLNDEEKNRALRFKFEIHRQRFVIGRGMLRKILSKYTNILPEELIIQQSAHAKPFLKKNSHFVDFNLSHSENTMLCAVGYHVAIGIDIEKIRSNYDMRIAERFFSVYENTLLNILAEPEKKQIFFQLWTGKEAIIKMTGKGLWAALSSFSIDPERNYQTILLDKKNKTCHLKFFQIDSEYSCALATTREVQHIEHFSWNSNDKPISYRTALALEK